MASKKLRPRNSKPSNRIVAVGLLLRSVKKNKKKLRKTLRGGRAIASGSYGCVFDPALKCAGATKRESDKISKLMLKKNAETEYEKIASLRDKLRDIPNYDDYFLLSDITICEPSKLQPTDLAGYTDKCTGLIKHSITRTNINTVLDSMKMINMKNGGLPIEDFIYANGSFVSIAQMHNSLVKLLMKGIVPMNAHNVYHCDIKDSNIVIDTTGKPRLIDWGLATDYVPFIKAPFPVSYRNRPLQFNVPFSVIIFTDKFYERYTQFLKENAGGGGGGGAVEPTPEILKSFIIEYIDYWIKERGPGHIKFINNIMDLLFTHDIGADEPEKDPKVFEKEYTMTYITDYVVDVLVHFTKYNEDGTLNLREYFDNVFIQIADVWGFITSYYPLIEMLSRNYDRLTPGEIKIFNQLRFIFVEYLYNPRHTPINIGELLLDFEILGKILHIKNNGTLETYKSPITSSDTIEVASAKPDVSEGA